MGNKYSWYEDRKLNETAKVLTQLIDEHKKYDKELKKREYTINIIGYGNMGESLLKELAEVVKEPNSKIKKINVWFRDKPNRTSQQLSTDFLSLFSNTEEKGNKVYNKLCEIIKFRPVKRLDYLKNIADQSKDNDSESDLLIVATNYEWLDDLVRNENTPTGKRIIPKNLDELLKEKGKDNILNLIKTTAYKAPESESGLMSKLKEFQDKRIAIENVITNMQMELEKNNDKNYKNESKIKFLNSIRINILKHNLIGINELGKALKGYKGTILNIVNEIDIATHALMSSADMEFNRIWGPTDNDYGRAKLHAKAMYLESISEEKIGINIDIPFPYGPHGEGIVLDEESILFGNKTWKEYFETQAEIKFEELLKRIGLHGEEYYQRKGRVSEDTVMALMYTIGSILTEENNAFHRGSVYQNDHEITTGMIFNIMKGTIAFPKNPDKYIEQAGSKARNRFIEETKIIRDLTKNLIKEELIKPYNLRQRTLEFPEQISLQEPKTSFVDDIIHGIKDFIKPLPQKETEEKKEPRALLYLRNPVDFRSILLYDLNSENMLRDEITFPQADDKTSIIGIKALNDKAVALIEHQNRNKFSYKLFLINHDTLKLEQIAEFSSNQINDFDFVDNHLFYVARDNINNSVRVFNIEEKKIVNYKDPIIDKEFYFVRGRRISNGYGLLALRDDGILYWEKDKTKYPVKMADINKTPTYMDIYRMNGKELLVYKSEGAVHIKNIKDYKEEPVVLKTTDGVIGLYAENEKIETFHVNSNSEFVETLWKSYKSLVKGKKDEEYSITISDDEKDIIGDKITSINVTKNTAIIGGWNGYVIYKKNPFRFEGRYIEQTSGCQALIERA